MPLLRPDGPRPVIDGSNTTIQDYTDSLIRLRDHIVRMADRAKSADETEAEVEHRAMLVLNERYRALLEEMRKQSYDLDHTIRGHRDRYKQARKDRRITNIM